jgi:hypothetical protein
MNESQGKIVRDWIAILLSVLAITVAFLSWYFSNEVSQEALSNSKIFGEINAEVQWSDLLKSYHEINEEIKVWEQDQKFEKVDTVVKSYDELEKTLKLIRAPEKIKSLYKIRYDRYQSLENVARLYEPVKERLKRIDFTLHAPPRLPQPTAKGVSIN